MSMMTLPASLRDVAARIRHAATARDHGVACASTDRFDDRRQFIGATLAAPPPLRGCPSCRRLANTGRRLLLVRQDMLRRRPRCTRASSSEEFRDSATAIGDSVNADSSPLMVPKCPIIISLYMRTRVAVTDNTRILLRRQCDGIPTADDFEIVTDEHAPRTWRRRVAVRDDLHLARSLTCAARSAGDICPVRFCPAN